MSVGSELFSLFLLQLVNLILTLLYDDTLDTLRSLHGS